MKNKVRKKPTVKEMASAIIEINNKVNQCMHICQNIDNVIGLYIKMNGDIKKFSEYINKEMDKAKKEQNDKNPNGKIDRKDIPSDSGDEGSRSEGVRKGPE